VKHRLQNNGFHWPSWIGCAELKASLIESTRFSSRTFWACGWLRGC
jgi:hypothetical protein